MTTSKPERFDICRCGDYRHQHENGTGKCYFGKDLTHGYEFCLKFEIDNASTAAEKERRKNEL